MNFIHAGPSISAGVVSAVIQILLTVGSTESWGTLTGVVVHKVNAGASVPARVQGTVVLVQLTLVPGEAVCAGALVAAVSLVDAGAAVLAGAVLLELG